MAVVLCRDGKPFSNPVPAELRGLPRISLDCEPVPGHLSYRGKQVTTRTESHLAYLEQPKEKTQKELHDRHQLQLTQCGFHASNCKPYRELGSVELDDGKLILETLGQAKKEQDQNGALKSSLKKPSVESAWQPVSLVSPYQVKLHSKTPAQFPSELLHLDDKLKQGELQLGHMKRGKSLYGLLEEERQKKELEEKERLQEGQSAALRQWREAEVPIDFTGAENGFPQDHQQTRSSLTSDLQITVGDASEVDLAGSTDEGSSGSIIDKWYRQLCVMVWILKSMRLESPHHSISLSKCWDLNRPYTDDSTGRRRYEYSRDRIAEWDELKRTRFVMKPPKFRNKVASIMALLSPTKKRESIPKDASKETQSSHTSQSMSQLEEEEMKKREKFQERITERWTAPLSATSMDIAAMQAKFLDSDEKRRMIVHEQLAAMERDRMEALQQRLGALKVSVNMWKDLAAMRQGLEIESTAMARKKLLMNYKWYQELIALLPAEVKGDYYCQQLLECLSEIADHMCSVGPRGMSRKKLIQVLATLGAWELKAPDIAAAIEHLIRHVVYVAEEDYREWLKQHIAVQQHLHKHKGVVSHAVGGKISRAPSQAVGKVSRAPSQVGGRISRAPSQAGGKKISRAPSQAGGRISRQN